jgi:hypothetical protein
MATVHTEEEDTDILDLIISINGTFFIPAIAIFGFISNVLVLVVLSMSQYRKNVNCFYLRFLAVSDNLNLIGISIALIKGAMKELMELGGDPFCKVFLFIAYFASPMTTITIVAITFNRFLAVVFPLKAGGLTTFRGAKLYYVSVLVLCSTYGSPGLIFGQVPQEDPVLRCGYDGRFTGRGSYELSFTVLVMLTFFLLIGLNACIFYDLKKRKTELEAAKSKENKDDKAVMAMVTVVTVTYIILTSPWVLQIIVWESVLPKGDLTIYQIKQRYFSYIMCSTCYAINYSTNFLLYVICSRRFRHDFMRILRCSFRPAIHK